MERVMDKKLHDYLWHSCCEENAKLREIERLTRERDEALIEVSRLEGLILDWYGAEVGEAPRWEPQALFDEARRIRAAKGE